MIGCALGVRFDVGRARRHLHEAIQLYQLCDANGLVAAYNDLASVELDVGRVENAQRALDGLKAVVAESPSLYGTACARLIACEIAEQLGESSAAIELAEEALAAAIVREYDLFEGEALRCKGVSLRAIGRVTEALPALERSLAIFGRLMLEGSAKRAAAELSLAYACAGDVRASALIDETMASSEQGPPDVDSRQVLWPLAQALDLTGRTIEARAMLQRAYAVFETRRHRLRNPRDKMAFSRLRENAALQRAYELLAVDSREPNAHAETPLARRVQKKRSSRHHQPPAQSL
jgi:tetratricopeptide (TPR) repeat protein